MNHRKHPCPSCGRATQMADLCKRCRDTAIADVGLPDGEWVLSGATKVWVAAPTPRPVDPDDPTAGAYDNCGTTAAYRRHLNEGQKSCKACRAHMSRTRQINRTGTAKVRKPLPCGTLAAYERHYQHGEMACDDCLEVRRIYYRELMRTRRETTGDETKEVA